MTDKEQYNIDLANRQIEVNEWAYSNKMDTLFVFQLLFITLIFVAILMLLKSQGLFGAAFVWYAMAVLAVLNVMIIIYRSVYTSTKRDSRMWNRKNFNGDGTQPSPLTRGDASYQAYIDSVRGNYGAAANSPSCTCPTPASNC
jgi:magnesium-transporting ATPase (P-type)